MDNKPLPSNDTVKYRVVDSYRRMNLGRPDIKELPNGSLITCKIEDVRYWHETIRRLDDLLDLTLGELAPLLKDIKGA